MQEKIKNIVFNSCILLSGILLMLLLFGPQVKTNSFLQVIGRMHPLTLHFPIVLLIVALVWEFATIRTQNAVLKNAGDWLLLAAAVTSLIAALMGLFLSQEEGYDSGAIALHKWTGAAVAFLSVIWYTTRNVIRKSKAGLIATGLCGMAGVILTGHEGASITHGEGFLFPAHAKKEKKEVVPLENAVVFTHMVKPILETKCISCHNTKKSKGDLIMETEALLLKGGKNGKLWDSTSAGFGLMLNRIHLPIEEKEHMPPKGKQQLSDDEITILYHWIKSGASFTKKVMEHRETDTLRLLAAAFLQPASATAAYSFAAADDAVIQKLNTDYRIIKAVATQSPALHVAFYGAGFFKPEQLKELKPIKEQIVSLHLANMPLKDDDLAVIEQFKNLHTLNLAFTSVTGKGLVHLSRLPQLKQLSLAGLTIRAADAEVLKSFPKLSTVFLWNSSLSETDLTNLRKNMPSIIVDAGFKSDTVVATLNAPIIEGKEQIFTDSLQLTVKHYIKGAILHYTTDGSEPDSNTSLVYKGHITISQPGLLKVKAFLPGWISSTVASKQFYKTGILADSIQLLTQPSPNYKGDGGKTLINRETGEMDFRNGKWLGYIKNDMQAVLYFNKPVTLSQLSFSTLVDIGSYIMPAYQIEVWGGEKNSGLKLLKKINPKQPSASQQVPPYLLGFDCKVTPVTVSIVKIVAKPVPVLPAWHPGKGTPGWVFIDEVFLN